jgi:hydroxymethylbilane synthase
MSIRIGTRGSKLALIQAQKVAEAIKVACPDTDIEIVVIQTSGDWKPSQGETLLSAVAGGKGLFAKEIEMALMDGRINVGVHSLKDVETFMPAELEIRHVLTRDDPRDAFISHKCDSIESLPQGATVGTSSVRRGAILLSMRPDLKIVPLRGNVDTRLEKLANGQVDATLLAVAGLSRLGLTDKITEYIAPETMLPAVCQGVIGLQIMKGDDATAAILDTIHNEQTGMIAAAERSLLSILDGSCRTPIGSFAQWVGDDTMRLRGLVTSHDGTDTYAHEETTTINTTSDAIALGIRVGTAIKTMTPEKFLQAYA